MTSREGWLKSLYLKMLNAADNPHAFRICCLVAFCESSFFPLPPDLMIIPMGIANRRGVFKLALACTICSVLGGILGYGIGYFLFETLGSLIIHSYGLECAMERFQEDFKHYGFMIIALKGLTPIPFKLVTIASGIAKFDFVSFVVASCIARGFRFYLLATLIWFFGPLAKPYIEKYLHWIFVFILVGIGIGFLVLKLYC